jgi:hypothetical protein
MSSLESWWWTLLFVVILPMVAIGGALLVRRVVGVEVLARHNDVAGFIYAVIGVVYAVLLGFSAIIVWEQFRNAREVAELEANAVADLYRDTRAFPPDAREEVIAELREYVRLVIEEEWPAMVAGEASEQTWAAYNLLWHTYQDFTPQDEGERIWYEESVERLNFLGDQRRIRLLSTEAGVPTVMWAVLLGAGAVTIAFSFLFGVPSRWAQGAMTGALALTIGIVLLAILSLQRPFAGITHVDAGAFEQVREILDQESESSDGRSP